MSTLIMIAAAFTFTVFIAAAIQSSTTGFRNKVRKLEYEKTQLEINLHDLSTDVNRLRDKELSLKRKLNAHRELESFTASRAEDKEEPSGLLSSQGKKGQDPKKDPLVAHLIRSGAATREQVDEAAKRKRLTGDAAGIPDILVKMGYVEAAAVLEARREIGS